MLVFFFVLLRLASARAALNEILNTGALAATALLPVTHRSASGGGHADPDRTWDSIVASSPALRSIELFLRTCWQERNSRHILLFLCMTFAFMFIEFFYGLMSNSLSLISDAGHMMLDCMGLVIGLLASYISRVKPNRIFTYGYGRFETLSGFVNGVFLVFVALSVALEALERLAAPPNVQGDQLVLVAIVGFVINMIGLAMFHQHAHGDSHGHACNEHGHSHGPNPNMVAMYVHILSDALGSLGVITSTVLIRTWGWMILDPICSLCISALIFASVVPLVRSTARVLLQGTPVDSEAGIKRALVKVLLVDGVVGYREPHFWLQSSQVLVGTLHVHIRPTVDAQRVLHQVTSVLATDAGCTQATVQLDHDAGTWQWVTRDAAGAIFQSATPVGPADDGHCPHNHHNHHNHDHHDHDDHDHHDNLHGHGHSHGGAACTGHGDAEPTTTRSSASKVPPSPSAAGIGGAGFAAAAAVAEAAGAPTPARPPRRLHAPSPSMAAV